jgi:pimeloyl-ACP methyl ester carboxylesterase
VPLHHALIAAQDAPPRRWALVLHGILGSGANFRTFARRLANEVSGSGWGFVLVDLRGHGASEVGSPPHTITAAAADLRELEADLPIAAVIGHSFGGKVALAYADDRRARGAALARASVLDSSPTPRPAIDRPDDSRRLLDVLRSVPQPLPSRERFLELVEGAGYPRAISEWLAMNVRRAPDGFRLRLDLDVMTDLIGSYFALDAWPLLERIIATTAVDYVIGGASDSVSVDDRQRLEALAAHAPRLAIHVLPDAGHWVHVDDPDGLLRTLARSFSEES